MDEMKIDVLDKGFVRLVDHYGTDGDIVAAARVSTSGEGVEVRSSDRGLLRYLMRHRHTTPFEMVDFKFHIKAPIFVVRQWHRHRTFSYNEMSARYSELPREWYVPAEKDVRKQSTKNKQGRKDEVMEHAERERLVLKNEGSKAFDDYRLRLGLGMARELARINLPLSTYTEFYAKGNLHNWLHFLSLRMDSHAQYEIRMFAEAIGKMIEEKCPLAWQAFEDYRLNGMSLTAYDVKAIRSCHTVPNWFTNASDFPTKREYEEFLEKVNLLGLDVPHEAQDGG